MVFRPRKVLAGAAAGVFFLIIGYGSAAETPIEETPMYGYDRRPMPANERAIHDEFIQYMVREAGSREAAAKRALQLAWQYYNSGDYRTAMKRFNQAWLLDPNNAEIFLGFGLLMSDRQQNDQAARFYRRSLELDPANNMTITNLALVLKRNAMALGERSLEAKPLLGHAEDLFCAASQVATSDQDLDYIYYNWAVIRAMEGNFPEAWEKVHLCRKHGGKSIQDGFVKQLSGAMPEPQE